MTLTKTSLSLRHKFILGFLAVVLFTGLTAGLAGRYLINKMVLAEARRRVHSDLNVSREIYNQVLTNIGTKIQLTADRFFLRDTLDDGDFLKTADELKKILERENFDLLYLTDPQGVVLYRAHHPGHYGDNLSSLPVIQYPQQRKFVQTTFLLSPDALQAEGEQVPKDVNTSVDAQANPSPPGPQAIGAMVMGAGAPIVSDGGTLLGILAGGVILNRNFSFVDYIQDAIFFKEAGADDQPEVITVFLGNKRIATTMLDENGNRAIGTSLPAEAYQKVLVEGKNYLERSYTLDNWYITAYEPIRDITGDPIGVLGVGVFEGKYQRMKQEIVMVFLGLTFLAMILALAISFLLARNITQPVNILARKAEEIGRGDFVQIQPPSKDEIGSLAETFNRMSRSLKERDEKLQARTQELRRTKEELERTNAILLEQSKRLKRSIKELSVLFEASKKTSSSLSLKEILDAIMDLLMDKFQTDIWSIRLLDEDGFLRIKSQRGLSPEFVEAAARKPTMDSYSGECFLTNRIIIVEDARQVTKKVSTNVEVREGIQSFGLVPISVEGEVLGVLAGASKREKGFFTEDYSDFMKTLAQQLAVAIRNARLYEKVKSFSEEMEKEVLKRTEELRVKSQLLAQSEKMAALGEMADRVAHETRNPIVTVGGFARRIRRNLPPDDPLVRYADIIIKEVERLEKMIYWITEYKKYISADFEATNINDIIEQAIEALKDKIESHNVSVTTDLLPDPPLVRIDKKNMEFVFLNLFENGIESMDSRGVLHITTRQKDDNTIETIISDTGKGIGANDLRSIYYPFFTSMISGSGMGLTITHKIIKDHNGTLRVKSKPGEGTTFTVELPVIKEFTASRA